MDNLSMYLIYGICGALIVWLTRRKKYPDPKNLTPEFLSEQRKKMMTESDYLKWLRRVHTIFSAEAIERKEKGLIENLSLTNAIQVLEKEREDIKEKTGNGF